MSIYLWQNGDRVEVKPPLSQYLRESLSGGVRVKREYLPDVLPGECFWIDYGVGKGVTHPEHGITVYGITSDILKGFHSTLARGFPGIKMDENPLCYDIPRHHHGFGGFVRWVYFADPEDLVDFLGIDFCLFCRPTAGVANSFWRAYLVMKVLAEQGIPLNTQILLLGSDICQWPGIEECIANVGWTIEDWLISAPMKFSIAGTLCPNCGQETFADSSVKFCCRCGANRKEKEELKHDEANA